VALIFANLHGRWVYHPKRDLPIFFFLVGRENRDKAGAVSLKPHLQSQDPRHPEMRVSQVVSPPEDKLEPSNPALPRRQSV
jgi:hypothetical protein